ncbi:hypothetical protein [Methylobacterium sp. CM6247]
MEVPDEPPESLSLGKRRFEPFAPQSKCNVIEIFLGSSILTGEHSNMFKRVDAVQRPGEDEQKRKREAEDRARRARFEELRTIEAEKAGLIVSCVVEGPAAIGGATVQPKLEFLAFTRSIWGRGSRT